jgi:hypothetical protein
MAAMMASCMAVSPFASKTRSAYMIGAHAFN